ncbi:PREDICTED: uncharacterized protein LOC105452174 [Wasmannia auropunctata]|uniref:uncharacterized protein LOC105452174 n=1 Tax=Wasmannia auropunctata TaxID=64793 RepID=UPI0005EFD895|nr:PREDICTED: uncharacterized protein LOC105452174 [Wasmannia auropunctata]
MGPPMPSSNSGPSTQTSHTVTDQAEMATEEQVAKANEDIPSSVQSVDTVKSSDEALIEDLEVELLEAIGNRVAAERVLAPAIPRTKDDNGDHKISTSQVALIKKLSEAARLMADVQRDESLTRRSLVLTAISSSQKETLESSVSDEWLFGTKLGDRIRAAKTIEKSGKDLKTKPKVTARTKNFKAPPRRQPFRTMTSGGYRNKPYQNQFGRKNWSIQNASNRNSFQSQQTEKTPQKKT